MQTIPVNQTDSRQALTAMHPSTATSNNPIPLPALTAPAPGADKARAARTVAPISTAAGATTEADLDALLIRDPNTGAMHGLKFALLFNAGLALSGLVVWELWNLLVP